MLSTEIGNTFKSKYHLYESGDGEHGYYKNYIGGLRIGVKMYCGDECCNALEEFETDLIESCTDTLTKQLGKGRVDAKYNIADCADNINRGLKYIDESDNALTENTLEMLKDIIGTTATNTARIYEKEIQQSSANIETLHEKECRHKVENDIKELQDFISELGDPYINNYIEQCWSNVFELDPKEMPKFRSASIPLYNIPNILKMVAKYYGTDNDYDDTVEYRLRAKRCLYIQTLQEMLSEKELAQIEILRK